MPVFATVGEKRCPVVAGHDGWDDKKRCPIRSGMTGKGMTGSGMTILVEGVVQ